MLKDSIVIAYLKDPKERIWGMLRCIDSSGLFMEGINIDSFDEWIHDVSKGESGKASLSRIFFPTSRIEKILMDEPTGDLPSLSQRFEEAVKISVMDFFGVSKDT